MTTTTITTTTTESLATGALRVGFGGVKFLHGVCVPRVCDVINVCGGGDVCVPRATRKKSPDFQIGHKKTHSE